MPANVKSLGVLSVDLGVNAGGFSDKMKGAFSKAEKETDGFAKRTGKALKGITLGIAGVAAGITATVAKSAWDLQSDFDKAVRNMQTTLGVTETQAMDLAQQAKNVWENNWGDSIESIIPTMEEVYRILGVQGYSAQKATENVLSLRDAFEDIDDVQLLQSVNVLKDLGLTTQQSFDFVTRGFQRGLNASGDFLDSINEYGVQFREMELGAAQLWNLFNTGQQEGVLGLDKAADAVKEFRIRFMEFTDDQKIGLDHLGLSNLWKQFDAGQVTVTQAMDNILFGLQGLEDPVWRNTIGVEFFGTMWEDLGSKAMLAMSLSAEGMDSFTGATEDLGHQYDTLSTKIEGVWRKLVVSFSPVVDRVKSLLFAVDKDGESIFDKVNNFIDNTLDPFFLKISKIEIDFDFGGRLQTIKTEIEDIKTLWSGMFSGDFDQESLKANVSKFIDTLVETLKSDLVSRMATAFGGGWLLSKVLGFLPGGKLIAFGVSIGLGLFKEDIEKFFGENSAVKEKLEQFRSYWDETFAPTFNKVIGENVKLFFDKLGIDLGPDGNLRKNIEEFIVNSLERLKKILAQVNIELSKGNTRTNSFSKAVSEAGDFFSTFAETMRKWTFGSKFRNKALARLSGEWKKLNDELKATFGFDIAGLGRKLGMFFGRTAGVLMGWLNVVIGFWSYVLSLPLMVLRRFIQFVKDIKNVGLKQAVANLIDDIKDEFKKKWNGFLSWLDQFALPNFIKVWIDKLKIKSPSKVMMEIGRQTAAGLSMGFDKEYEKGMLHADFLTPLTKSVSSSETKNINVTNNYNFFEVQREMVESAFRATTGENFETSFRRAGAFL